MCYLRIEETMLRDSSQGQPSCPWYPAILVTQVQNQPKALHMYSINKHLCNSDYYQNVLLETRI